MLKVRMTSKVYVNRTHDRVERQMQRNLFRVAAYVRTTARRSIRMSPGNRSSPIGSEAPFSHTRRLKNAIAFAKTSGGLGSKMIIGPGYHRTNTNRFLPRLTTGAKKPTIPSIIEYGGINRDKITGKSYKYTPRPYMRSALAKSLASSAVKNILARKQ